MVEKKVEDATHPQNPVCLRGFGDGGVHAPRQHPPLACLRMFDPHNEKNEPG
jgi:hypothetical protein